MDDVYNCDHLCGCHVCVYVHVCGCVCVHVCGCTCVCVHVTTCAVPNLHIPIFGVVVWVVVCLVWVLV